VNGLHKRQSLVAASVTMAVVAPVVWMLLDRMPPYDRIGGTITPESPKPGEWVDVKWIVRVKRDCPANETRNVTRVIIDSTGKINEFAPFEGYFRSMNPQLASADRTELVRTFQLPSSLTPGPARYMSKACFACNPLQYIWPVCVDRPGINFVVSEP